MFRENLREGGSGMHSIEYRVTFTTCDNEHDISNTNVAIDEGAIVHCGTLKGDTYALWDISYIQGVP